MRWLLIFFALVICACSEDSPSIPPVEPSGDIPCVSIVTDNHVGVVSKEYNVDATITLSSKGEDDISFHGKIRGRGNATWREYPKKPYKITLDSKQSIFGFSPSKNWILLAEYSDKSLARTAFMSELARVVGMTPVIGYQHVEVYVDNEYMGVYLLTEQVERDNGRVKVARDGYILEDDNYYYDESLYFTTKNFSFNYTFKHPDPDEDEILRGDVNYVFIVNYLNALEEALLRISWDTETYKKYLDVKSFARWFVVAEVTQNWDPNHYYALSSRSDKLKKIPFWDAEWTFGLALGDEINTGWAQVPTKPRIDAEVWSNRKYFDYLLRDPAFFEEVEQQFQILKAQKSDIIATIKAKAESIRTAQKNNFKRWPILDEYVGAGLIALGSWDAELAYTLSFFEQRMAWMDEWLKSYKSKIVAKDNHTKSKISNKEKGLFRE